MDPIAIYAVIVIVILLSANSERIKAKKRKDSTKQFNPDYMNMGPYGTGWKWNENTQRWDPPGYKGPEIKFNRSEPTFEEWKTAQQEGSAADQEQPKKPSTYRFVGSQLPKDDTIIHKQTMQQTTYKAPPRPEPKPVQKPTPNERTHEYQYGYQAASILTANERYNYKNLKIAADKKGYIICPKVRLADVINPSRIPQDKSYMVRFGKIKSKHVDFVLYDSDMRYPKVVIELDDSSHRREDRQERDEFVDFILRDCGIKVIHTYNITPDILDGI